MLVIYALARKLRRGKMLETYTSHPGGHQKIVRDLARSLFQLIRFANEVGPVGHAQCVRFSSMFTFEVSLVPVEWWRRHHRVASDEDFVMR